MDATRAIALRFDSEMQVKVTAASWSRFYLRFEVEVRGANGTPRFLLVSDEARGTVGALFKDVRCEAGIYTIEANVTNDGWRECLEEGSYRIVALDEFYRWNNATISPRAAGDLAVMARAFPYGRQNQAQVVYFDIDGQGEHVVPLVKVLFTALDECGFEVLAGWDDGYRPINWKRRLRIGAVSVVEDAVSALSLGVHRVFGACANKPTIAFISETSDTLRPNMKAVHDRMLERGLDQAFSIEVACYVPQEGKRSLSQLADLVSAMSRASCIIVDDYVPALSWLDIAQDVTVIQLWHAGAGFKAAGYARWGLHGAPSPMSAHRKYTYGISSSAKIAPFFSEVFGIDDEQIIPLGMPRMDGFLDEANAAKARRRLAEAFPPCDGKEVVLFAPTYRGTGRNDAGYPFDMVDFEALYRVCGESRIVIFKMHPWVAGPVPIPEEFGDRLFDASGVADINDLFPAVDVLVTDYSSSIFEFSLMGKPMLFFAFDRDEFACSRGFHRDYEQSAPGRVCTTFAELVAALERRDYDFEKVGRFVESHFDKLDDHAADRVIDWLVLGDLPDEYSSAIESRRVELEELSALVFDRAPSTAIL